MSTRMSAVVMMRTNGGEGLEVRYYVRAVEVGSKIFDMSAGRDAWAAYCDEPMSASIDGELRCLWRVERLSDTPRDTIEAAATDMYAAIRARVVDGRGRVVRGNVPEEAALWVGPNPMGD